MNKAHMLAQEEIKALKLFLGLVYAIFVSTDIVYYYIIQPRWEPGLAEGSFPADGLGIWLYILGLPFLILGIYLMKTRYLYAVKYIIFIGLLLIDFINNIMIYYGTTEPFLLGNLVELFFVFSSPFFVSKRYFWVVNVGMIGKYAATGIILQTDTVVANITICIVLALVCWMLLVRFDSYIDTLKMISMKMKEAERMAIIGNMATAIGHEIRNPLAALKGFTQLQAEKHPEEGTYYDIMTKEIERMNEIVSELMEFGKPKSKEHELHNIQEIILYVIQILEQFASKQGITIKTDFQKSLPKIYCDETQMKQVFLNLIKNAIESMQNGGSVIVSVFASQTVMKVKITDMGCGIVESKIPQLGEAFYTTKKSGTGLGLMITYKIIEEHDGTIQFTSNVGKGTTVEVTIPIK
ncbi:ATP-binding protein [Bacillus manliponensis]|uniref:ATP-binding protein n=1 Tax=Bacillus manliponensis TaxID=574376 RepID=UPI0035110B5A